MYLNLSFKNIYYAIQDAIIVKILMLILTLSGILNATIHRTSDSIIVKILQLYKKT